METVFGSSATVEISACLHRIVLRSVSVPRHIPFLQSPAEISRKRYFCSSAAAEHMKGVWSREGEVSVLGEEEGMTEEKT